MRARFARLSRRASTVTIVCAALSNYTLPPFLPDLQPLSGIASTPPSLSYKTLVLAPISQTLHRRTGFQIPTRKRKARLTAEFTERVRSNNCNRPSTRRCSDFRRSHTLSEPYLYLVPSRHRTTQNYSHWFRTHRASESYPSHRIGPPRLSRASSCTFKQAVFRRDHSEVHSKLPKDDPQHPSGT